MPKIYVPISFHITEQFRLTSHYFWLYQWICKVRKPAFGHVHPGKIQISLRIQNLHWAHFGQWKMQRFFMRTTKTLITLRGCIACFGSSLNGHVRRYVFSLCGSKRSSYTKGQLSNGILEQTKFKRSYPGHAANTEHNLPNAAKGANDDEQDTPQLRSTIFPMQRNRQTMTNRTRRNHGPQSFQCSERDKRCRTGYAAITEHNLANAAKGTNDVEQNTAQPRSIIFPMQRKRLTMSNRKRHI